MTLKTPQKTPFFRPFLASPPRPKRGYPPPGGVISPKFPKITLFWGYPPFSPEKGVLKKGPNQRGFGVSSPKHKVLDETFYPPPRGVKS